MDLPDDRDVLGRLIANRYLIEAPCERTRASSSYRAYHLALDRMVLLRILPARSGVSRDACRRALVLAERASSLPSAHIGRSLDVGLVEGRFPFVIQEYSKGRSLQHALDSNGPFEIQRLLSVGRQLAAALETAHAAGECHGNLRLDNIWLESLAAKPDWLRLFGFGLAELPEGDFDGPDSGVFRKATETIAGLEQVSGSVVRTDIYGFGACLFELASGTRPSWTPGDIAGILDSDLSRAPGLGPRAVLRGLARVLERCLFLVPDTNYQNMREISADLGHLEVSARAFCPAPSRGGSAVTAVARPPRRVSGVRMGGPKVIVKPD